MKGWLWAVLAAGASFVGGTLVGRWSTPVKVVELTREKVVQVQVEQERKAEVKRETEAKQRNVITRWIPQPGCKEGAPPIIEQQVQEGELKRSDVMAQVSSNRGQYRLADKEEMKLRAPEAPRWSASALIGLSLPDRATQQYGAHLQYRVAGPLQVGAWILHSSTWAGGVSVGVTF